MPQIVIGHRLWAQATNNRERFVRIENLHLRQRQIDKTMWIDLDIKRSDLQALRLSPQESLTNSRLKDFHEVIPIRHKGDSDRNIVRFEQIIPSSYAQSPIDSLDSLVKTLYNRVWCIMRTVPPYRRYYLWAARDLSSELIDPLLTVYLVIFFLSSVTRYRPYYFEEIQNSRFGNVFDEIIQTQGQQMLFHLASEFQKRDVSWPTVL